MKVPAAEKACMQVGFQSTTSANWLQITTTACTIHTQGRIEGLMLHPGIPQTLKRLSKIDPDPFKL